MKRIYVFMVLLLLSLSLFASSAFTYGFSQVGEKYENESFGAMSVTLGFAPLKEKQYGIVEVTALLGWERFFRGVDLSLSTPLFTSSNDVFSYAFSNRVLWEPSVGFLTQYRADGNRWMMGFMLSPLKFADTSFSYEFLSPYLTFNLPGGKRAYGVRIMKVSAFLEI